MTTPRSETKSLLETGKDTSNQESVSPRNHRSRQSSKQQVRHRASIACAACRDRRIRCVVPKGESECIQCKRTGIECIIKDDDERRRPISKAYTSSLSERITLLEAMLKDQGVVPPPAVYPPRTRQEAQAKLQHGEGQNGGRQQLSIAQQQQTQLQSFSHVPQSNSSDSPNPPNHLKTEGTSPPDSETDDFGLRVFDQAHSNHSAFANNETFQPSVKEPSPFRNLDPPMEDIVHRLLSTKGNITFDQLAGRFRFFGPTANSHVYAESPGQPCFQEPPEQVRHAEMIIRSLTAPTYDYLMSCFWEYYNPVFQVLNREAFEAARDSRNPKLYSSFLQITVLAAGYRFADHERKDIRRLTVGNRESTLHRESKHMLDSELERPGGIPSIQALLVLSDLECGAGRDNTGWMYSGMANRLAFDIGLHLDCDDKRENDVQIRRQVMRACILYDKYWALFLGRPTSIKTQDISMDLLSKRFSMLSSSQAPVAESGKKTTTATEVEVHDQLVELMEISGKILDIHGDDKPCGRSIEQTSNVFGPQESDESAYVDVIRVDRQLQNWYRRLPEHLTWKPANIKAAPLSYFLLHQQYHVSMILLHRPWANYGADGPDSTSTSSRTSPEPPSSARRAEANMQYHKPVPNHALGICEPQSIYDHTRTSLSRNICTQQAIRVARIFWQHRQRFDGRKISVNGIQQAGTAAIALVAALAHQPSDAERRSYLGYLEIISAVIADMSHAYQPADRMDKLLKAVLVQLRGDLLGDIGTTAVPAHLFVSSGTSANTKTLSGQSWETSPGSIYSVLPTRRENPPEGEICPSAPQTFKRRRPAPSRHASEIAMQPTPFFGPGLTPPHTSGSFGHATGLTQAQEAQHQKQQQEQQQQSILTNLFGTPTYFGLDCLEGSAVDLSGPDLDKPGTLPPARTSENYVVVTPPADAFSMIGMHRSDQQQQQQLLLQPAGPTTANRDGLTTTVDSTSAGGLSSGPSPDSCAQAGIGGGCGAGNGDDCGGMDWTGNENARIDGIGTVNLDGLARSLEKAAGGRQSAGRRSEGGVLKGHELDYFSF